MKKYDFLNSVYSYSRMGKLIPMVLIILSMSIQAQERTELPDLGLQFKERITSSNTFIFSQSRREKFYPALGYFEHLKNRVVYNNKNFIIGVGQGLLEQQIFSSNELPTVDLTFDASLEYSFTKNFSAYVYGQYLTLPKNQSEVDLRFIGPLFEQTETGAGLKTNLKNMQIDIGTRTGFNPSAPSTMLHSKFSIGF